MNMLRQEPWSLLNQIQTEMNRILETRLTGKQNDNSNVVTSQWMPAVDIKEDAHQFVLYADIPGVDPNEIEIAMENNVLVIKGERMEEQQQESDNFSRLERIKGVFYRRFSLPDTADEEKISAQAKHGVLEIIIPKKEKSKPRKISIAIQQNEQQKLDTKSENIIKQ